jgi:hypothetical protein
MASKKPGGNHHEKSRDIECEEKLIYSDGANFSWKTDPVVRIEAIS